jgi:hypothetical protein
LNQNFNLEPRYKVPKEFCCKSSGYPFQIRLRYRKRVKIGSPSCGAEMEISRGKQKRSSLSLFMTRKTMFTSIQVLPPIILLQIFVGQKHLKKPTYTSEYRMKNNKDDHYRQCRYFYTPCLPSLNLIFYVYNFGFEQPSLLRSSSIVFSSCCEPRNRLSHSLFANLASTKVSTKGLVVRTNWDPMFAKARQYIRAVIFIPPHQPSQ